MRHHVKFKTSTNIAHRLQMILIHKSEVVVLVSHGIHSSPSCLIKPIGKSQPSSPSQPNSQSQPNNQRLQHSPRRNL